jgi:hypothetical protein
MRTIRAFLFRLGGLFHKRRRVHELAQEIESNLQLHIEDNLRACCGVGELLPCPAGDEGRSDGCIKGRIGNNS